MQIAAILALGAPTAAAVLAESNNLPDAPGKTEVMETCTQCHGVDLIIAQKRTPEEWSDVLGRMVGNGASLTDDQYQKVLTYLSTNLTRTTASPAER